MSVETLISVESRADLVQLFSDYVCRKRDLSDSKDWSLSVQLDGKDFVLPLDRTIESLAGNYDLTLVRREQSRAGIRQNSTLSNDSSGMLSVSFTSQILTLPNHTLANFQLQYSVNQLKSHLNLQSTLSRLRIINVTQFKENFPCH